MTIATLVMIALFIALLLLGLRFIALALAATVMAVNAGICYVLLRISEAAQQNSGKYSLDMQRDIWGLYYYSEAWMTIYGLSALALLVWILVLDIQRRRSRERTPEAKTSEPSRGTDLSFR